MKCLIRTNKPGTAQISVISKAQKYSKEQLLETFGKKNFQKKYLVKKVAYCRKAKNPKRDPLGSLNVFFTNRKLQKKSRG